MLVRVELPDEAYHHLLTMASQARLTVAEMVQIGAFNLVALWIREKGTTVPLDATDGMDGGK